VVSLVGMTEGSVQRQLKFSGNNASALTVGSGGKRRPPEAVDNIGDTHRNILIYRNYFYSPRTCANTEWNPAIIQNVVFALSCNHREPEHGVPYLRCTCGKNRDRSWQREHRLPDVRRIRYRQLGHGYRTTAEP
jgi:hypothetical protein